MEKTFDSLEGEYERLGKPFVLSQIAYASAANGCRGLEEYSVDDRRISYWEPKDSTPNDMETQAVIYDEIMRGVASRPWITGVYPFGYFYYEMQDKGYNIRGKPAEKVVSGWYRAIEG